MKYNVEYYYQQKSRKKKLKKIKISLGILIVIIIVGLFTQHQITKSESSVIYNQEPENSNIISREAENEEELIVVIDEDETDKNNKPIDEPNKPDKIDEKKTETWKTVDIDYFRDAVFIGNSRTEGLILNNGLASKTTSYTNKGLTVDSIFTDKVININGKKVTIMDALKETSFSKVYIMLGINETGWIYSDMFIKKYAKIIDEIKQINPNCIIYIQSIIPVTQQVSSEHQYIKNSKIEEYNSLIKKMAEEKNAYFLNVQEAVVNSNGVLPDDAATDGIHLNRKYSEKCFEYLKNHVIGE